MDLFKLPHNTSVNKVIPKNAFDNYTTSRQKKLFTDLVLRITWTHKLSPDTINLEAKEIKEIQIFKIELKTKEDIQPILDIIDKSIPYHIIFVIELNQMAYISTSSKHPHPINDDKAVIDWTFKTDWFSKSESSFSLKLKKSIDAVYHDFCTQISGEPAISNKSLNELISHNKKLNHLEKEISKLKSALSSSIQFKNKVELNLKIKALENELKIIKNSK